MVETCHSGAGQTSLGGGGGVNMKGTRASCGTICRISDIERAERISGLAHSPVDDQVHYFPVQLIRLLGHFLCDVCDDNISSSLSH